MDQQTTDQTGTDENKVIHIFQRHRRGEDLHFPVEEGGELIVSPDGFNYVTFREDKPNGLGSHAGDAELPDVLDVARKKHYIFKFLENHKEHLRIDNYYVPGDRLGDFVATLSHRPGQLVEIRQFIPDHMA